MSYEILYNNGFVKLSNGDVIPLVLAGSNNCHESATGRRSRSWQTWGYHLPSGGSFGVNPQVVLDAVQAEIDAKCAQCSTDEWLIKEGVTPADVLSHFGYYVGLTIGGGSCRDTSAAKYRNFSPTPSKRPRPLMN